MNSISPTAILEGMIQSLKPDDKYIDDSHQMLSPRQVAEYLGMHINSIYRIIGSGQLRVYDLSVGRDKTYYRIKREDLENYMEERYCVR